VGSHLLPPPDRPSLFLRKRSSSSFFFPLRLAFRRARLSFPFSFLRGILGVFFAPATDLHFPFFLSAFFFLFPSGKIKQKKPTTNKQRLFLFFLEKYEISFLPSSLLQAALLNVRGRLEMRLSSPLFFSRDVIIIVPFLPALPLPPPSLQCALKTTPSCYRILRLFLLSNLSLGEAQKKRYL